MVSGGGGECSGQDNQRQRLSDGLAKLQNTLCNATHSSDTTNAGLESHESTCGGSDGDFSKTSTQTGGEKRLHKLDPEIKGNCVRDAHATASISCIAANRNPLNP